MKLLGDAEAIPLPRGPFLRAEAIAKDAELFNGAVSPAWVRRNVPGKVVLGHSTVGWYRNEVVSFIESRRRSA